MIAGLQHFQRFTDQLFVLVDNPQQAFNGFGVVATRHKDAPHHDGDSRAVAVRGGASLQQRHGFIHVVVAHLLKSKLTVEMGDLNALLIFTQLHQTFSGINGFLPVAGGLINLQELLQRADAEICFIHQLREHIFSAIVQPRGHVIPPQLLHRKETLIVGQRGAFHQGLVNTYGAIDLAARAEQVAQGEMRFNRPRILFKHIEEQVYRFVLLIAQEEVHPRNVVAGEPVGLILFCLLRTSAAHIPAIGCGYRQKQKQQLQHSRLFLHDRHTRAFRDVRRRGNVIFESLNFTFSARKRNTDFQPEQTANQPANAKAGSK